MRKVGAEAHQAPGNLGGGGQGSARFVRIRQDFSGFRRMFQDCRPVQSLLSGGLGLGKSVCPSLDRAQVGLKYRLARKAGAEAHVGGRGAHGLDLSEP